jgi:uncharacterized protein YegP (UPF0339 family)
MGATFWPFISKRLYCVVCFQSAEDRLWRWRIESATNGQKIATSESYADRWSMERTAKLVGKNAKWKVLGLFTGDMEVDP